MTVKEASYGPRNPPVTDPESSMSDDIRALRTEADYDRALAEIVIYFGNPPAMGTREADRFNVIAAVVEAYEAQHWPIESANPVRRGR
jgi:antitoxin component HigA of HigAB toxin-antitoxin module